ncbi:hypothetical protein V1264_009014 [Littorina saxatilis]|uniref:SPOR domain-containing protein n=2 Tax=Littorina saxatilis TaxID=31220 RepID=A0AAN9AQS3_9CAEN
MLFAIASLVLSAILMTQADVGDIVSDVTNVEPLSEELYIFEVTYDAEVADLKGALESASVKVRHSFRVLGTHQYFFVVADEGRDALSQLNFPEGSQVTQYPVEHLSDYLEMVGAGDWNETDTTDGLHDKDLLVATQEFVLPEGSSTSQLKSTMKHYAKEIKKPAEITKSVHYVVVGRYPPKIYYFLNLDENSAQKALLHGLDEIGGPGNNVFNVLRLHKV